MGFRTFTTVWELLWYYCSLVFGSPIQQVWHIWFYCDCTPPTILLRLLLCLWTWSIFFWWVPVSSCWYLFSGWSHFWCFCWRGWAHAFLLCHLEPEVQLVNLLIAFMFGFHKSGKSLPGYFLMQFSTVMKMFHFYNELWWVRKSKYCTIM